MYVKRKDTSTIVRTHRLRLPLLAGISLLTFAAVEARLYYVQIHRHEHYARLAGRQQQHTRWLYPTRGDILDREGQTLATSTFYDSIYFVPPSKKWAPTPGLIEDVSILFGDTEPRVRAVLTGSRRTRLKRSVPPETLAAFRLLVEHHAVPGGTFDFERQSKRLYPKDQLAANIIGFAGIDKYGDNVGLEGIEYRYNDILGGELQKERVAFRNQGRQLVPMDEAKVGESFGWSLTLTIDGRIQDFAQARLAEQIEAVQAESGSLIVMDIRTGAILAMASYPTYDLNAFGDFPAGHRRNRAVTDQFEIGSVMKIMTTAILLDNNLLEVEELIDCQNGEAEILGRRIRDSHAMGIEPFSVVFAQSSNIGMATLSQRIEPSLFYSELKKFGVGERTGIDLPGESPGVLRQVGQWTQDSGISIALGYETSLTPLQVVTAVAAIANGGMRMRPHVVAQVTSVEGRTLQRTRPQELGRVASEATSRQLARLMRLAVERGTGDQGRVPGYSVGGKTGTARKVLEGRHYTASFAGFIPASDPRLAIYCLIDEPNPQIAFYGGAVAAPVFSKVAARAMRVLEIPPDLPMTLDDPPAPMPPRNPGFEVAQSEGGSVRAPWTAEAGELADSSGQPVDAGDGEWFSIGDELPEPEGGGDGSQTSLGAARMPLCVGLTFAEAIEATAEAHIPAKFLGTGIAIRQSPPPNAELIPGRQAVLIFASPSLVDPDLRRTRERRPRPAKSLESELPGLSAIIEG